MWILVAGCVLLCLTAIIIGTLSATVYKCEWGWWGGCDDFTPTPTIQPALAVSNEYTVPLRKTDAYNKNCADNAEPDPDFGSYGGKAWKDDARRAETTDGVVKVIDSTGTTYSSDGCGWCDARYYKDGKCYSAQDSTTPKESRKRVFVNEGWQWCDWDAAKGWMDTAKTGTACGIVNHAQSLSGQGSGGGNARKVRKARVPKRRSSQARKPRKKGARRSAARRGSVSSARHRRRR